MTQQTQSANAVSKRSQEAAAERAPRSRAPPWACASADTSLRCAGLLSLQAARRRQQTRRRRRRAQSKEGRAAIHVGGARQRSTLGAARRVCDARSSSAAKQKTFTKLNCIRMLLKCLHIEVYRETVRQLPAVKWASRACVRQLQVNRIREPARSSRTRQAHSLSLPSTLPGHSSQESTPTHSSAPAR